MHQRGLWLLNTLFVAGWGRRVEQIINHKLPASVVKRVVETQAFLAMCLLVYFSMETAATRKARARGALPGDCYTEACDCAGV
jgi:hypothetical protein